MSVNRTVHLKAGDEFRVVGDVFAYEGHPLTLLHLEKGSKVKYAQEMEMSLPMCSGRLLQFTHISSTYNGASGSDDVWRQTVYLAEHQLTEENFQPIES